jgi:hypothetical protein
MMRRRFALLLLLSLLISWRVEAHVGSPDIYVDGQAGPYHLFVTIRPPTVIPGVAELEIRSEDTGIRHLRAVPLPFSGPGARFAPVPDTLTRSQQDPQFFTGSLWMMAPGSWQVKITADGDRGQGVVAIPVPSAALSTRKMQAGLGALLSVLMGFLVLGAVAITGASVREAQLPAGATPDSRHKRRARIAMGIGFVVVLGVLWYGRSWWNAEASSYAQNVYKPLTMTPHLEGATLTLTLSDPGWLPTSHRPRVLGTLTPVRTIDDLVPDHGHLMHLYLIREPGLDVVYHLHPSLARGGEFNLKLPSMPAGKYKLYADVVHESSFPETLVASLSVPEMQGRPLSGDDASGQTVAWNRSGVNSREFRLPDGYRMRWIGPAGELRSKQAQMFQFALVDSQGETPKDMALYMGMLGHAAFVKTDGTVFAHIHPTGSVSMAAFMKAQEQIANSAAGDMAGMNHSSESEPGSLPNHVGFPFGLPSPGRYRVFVQMKHGDTVETGIFDMEAK